MRVEVLLSSVTLATLRGLAERRGTSVAGVLARAISHERFLDDVQSSGGRVMVVDRDGDVRVVVPR